MSNNNGNNLIGNVKAGIDSVKQEIDSAKQDVENVKKIAANLAKGNKLKAAKEAVKMLLRKLKDKDFIRRMILRVLIKFLPILLAGAMLFGIIGAVKDAMVNLISSASSVVGGFLDKAWKWLTNDFWTDIDQKIEYVVDAKTGQILGTEESMSQKYVDEKTGYTYDYNGNRYDASGNVLDDNGNIRETTKKTYTLVDQYTRELSRNGVSLQGLRLLGDVDSKEEEIEKMLENEETRRLIEKYIAEFIRADIITQQPHRNQTEAVVNPANQNLVDGGIYVYRTTKEPEVVKADFEDGYYSKNNEPVTEKNYQKMEYTDYEDFMERLEKNDKNLRYCYTIDDTNEKLIMVEIKTTVVKESSTPIGGWFGDLDAWLQQEANKKEEYELSTVEVDYKSLISKYTMPYEFLINLCEITQNPEFVYHVALLARDTNIKLVVQDDTTIVRETVESENYMKDYKNRENNYTSKATSSGEYMEKTRTVTITTTQTPVLKIESADTWSFNEEFEYTKNIEGTLTEVGPVEKNESIPSTLSKYHSPEQFEGQVDWGPDQADGYWYDKFAIRTNTKTQVLTTTVTYNEPILKSSIEKSKQFLGLLVNGTGKCKYDCNATVNADALIYSDPIALSCAKESEYVKNGINVKYRIPNSTVEEEPIGKLRSGLQMLYAALQSNSTGYNASDKLVTEEHTKDTYNIEKQYIENKDYESAYVVKMQGLVEHLQYLMTFPDEDYYADLPEDGGIGGGTIISGSEFWWPLEENAVCRISSGFGSRKAPTAGASTNHKGIDIATAQGTPIIASADGVVIVSAESSPSAGNWIAIKHENGYVTKYMHNLRNLVKAGDTVTRGQVIAYVGSTGRSTGPHLHFQVEFNGTPQNPLNYVSMNNKRPVSTGKVTISDETKLDTIYAIVASECSSSYDGALAVMTCVLNRCVSEAWVRFGGNNPYAQITATGQFSYGIPKYANNYKKYLNGNSPEHVKRAVDDALAGARNHKYTSFRTDSAKTRQTHPNGEEIGGNWYF